MPFSYSGNPASSTKDAVRFTIPDTVEASAQFQDAEIEWAITQEAGVFGAAARCLESLSRRFSMQADLATGDLSLSYSKQAQTMAERAKELRIRQQGSAAPTSAGFSLSEKEGFADNSDAVMPIFKRGQFTPPGAGGQTSSEGGTGEAESGSDI